ncbi:acyltransferase [Ferriphaselus sp. R-1]|uniref:acyltransferase n=1 Tax=Ferriphaselus sp. R-1 TaxID=1485544 RepID=UPI0009DCFF88|nr:acyltransferase [Ferriphaselus sp. R-1]
MSCLYLWKNRERPSLLSKRWLKVWAKRAFNLPGLIAIMLRRITLQVRGVQIGNLTIFEKINLNGRCARLKVGEGSIIGSKVHLALHERIEIGNRVVVNSNVQLLTGTHATKDPAWPLVAKPIVIGDYAWIAYNVIILPGVTVGEGAVIGAGAVVSRDVAAYSIVAGNPAKKVGERSKNLNYSPTELCSPFEAWLGGSNCDSCQTLLAKSCSAEGEIC